VALKKGRMRMEFRLRAVPDEDKPKILMTLFPVRAGSPSAAFASIANRYPVFELIRSQ
jgi:hypothetical protein